MSPKPAIVWFRQDLRLSDNAALSQAVESGVPLLPIYILDDENAGEWQMGGASRWWLHRSLQALNQSLDGQLRCFVGKADKILPQLAMDVDAGAAYWNRCYEPWRIRRDSEIEVALTDAGLHVESFNGSLLFEPQTVAKADGTPYRVFTPFFRKGCLQNAPEPPEPAPAAKPGRFLSSAPGDTPETLGLLPDLDWYRGMEEAWQPGEAGGALRLERFLEGGLKNYKEGRNRPDLEHVSRLSPHLHHGEISPRQVFHEVKALTAIGRLENDADHFLNELGWREFSSYLLYHSPDLPRKNLQAKFDRFPWRNDPRMLETWQRGRTGYPIVDAGMRELWQTGYMHNRVRMIVASFLVKNLLLHWHHGEDWFWDTLVDADLANNSASWQWVAGCGADAAPYFRIFNPVTQGKRFDPDGAYVRRYVPELAQLPNKYLHSPWQASQDILAAANIELGKSYPLPVVDLKTSRERALEAFRSLS